MKFLVRLSAFWLPCFAFLLLSGCLVPVPISTRPSGATVQIDGQVFGNSPVTPELDPSSSHVVELELEGYHRMRIDLVAIPSGWGGRLSPEYLDVELEPKASAAIESPELFPPTKSGTEEPVEPSPEGPPPADARLDPAASAMLLSRLAEVERLYKEGTIQEDEYRALRYSLLLNALLNAEAGR